MKKVQKGKVTRAQLLDGGAVQLGCAAPPYNHVAYPLSFPRTG